MPNHYAIYDISFPNLGISFEAVPRVLFSPFGFDIFMYAFCIVLGIIAAYFLAIWWAKKSGQKPEDYSDLLLIGVPLAIVGLRLYYLIFNWNRYSGQNFLHVFFQFRDGGLAIYGGIIGATLAAFIVSRRKKIPFTTLADTAAPSLPLGQAIGRFGNFFNREAFGGHTENLFAMQIRADQTFAPITQEIRENAIHAQGIEFFTVHPTFLYESFFNLILMAALLIYRPHKRFSGEILLLYFAGYGVIRFFIEALRTDQMMFAGLPLNRLMAAIFVIVSIGLLILGHLKKFPTRRNI